MLSRPWTIAMAVLLLGATTSCRSLAGDRELSGGDDAATPSKRDANAPRALDGGPLQADPNALKVVVENSAGLAVEIITLQCAGDCADVLAVAHGGNPPYSFAWSDGGSTAPARHLCPLATQELMVTVTDTEQLAGEFTINAQTASVPVTTEVLACGDRGAGLCNYAGGAAIPASGHYLGRLACHNGMPSVAADGGLATGGTLAFDLTVDPSQKTQTGMVYFNWDLQVIGATGAIDSVLDCSTGSLRGSWSGQWGVPLTSNAADGTLTLLPTGPIVGELTAQQVAGMPGTIAGSFTWHDPPGQMISQYDGTCDGVYTAERQP